MKEGAKRARGEKAKRGKTILPLLALSPFDLFPLLLGDG
jgi:hypothetical protein